jgi:predicted dehydrogenase
MRFALLGTHPDGIDMACALADSGRHEIIANTGAEPLPDPVLRRWGPQVQRLHDLEDLLADPAVEAVIVAGTPANRTVQLRRALQSERHVLCAYPPDAVPDGAYEAAMIQKDTGRVLLPLLSDALHPGVVRLAEVVRSGMRPLVEPRLIVVERGAEGPVLLDTGGHRPAFPGWDVLRALGGEIAEVWALAAREELSPEEPVLVSGRFERGLLFQAALTPYQSEPRGRIVAVGSHGRAELLFPVGPRGPAFLSWRTSDGELHEESWDAWDPWPPLVTLFEQAVAAVETPSSSPRHPVTPSPRHLIWQDAVRGLELDDAARRSVQKRRASSMEYQEASEEVGFKGTMTLVGCGIIWLTIVIIILANWFPKAGWAVVPLLIVFLGLQAFRWIVPRKGTPR